MLPLHHLPTKFLVNIDLHGELLKDRGAIGLLLLLLFEHALVLLPIHFVEHLDGFVEAFKLALSLGLVVAVLLLRIAQIHGLVGISMVHVGVIVFVRASKASFLALDPVALCWNLIVACNEAIWRGGG